VSKLPVRLIAFGGLCFYFLEANPVIVGPSRTGTSGSEGRRTDLDFFKKNCLTK
jgi:hypothetical protein